MKSNPWKRVLNPVTAAAPPLSQPPSLSPPAWPGSPESSEPQGEVLFDLFEGELGQVRLGRLLSGSNAGRVVTLRLLPGPPSTELAEAVELARGIADPKLLKALGVLQLGDSWYVASEYIAGVSLFELEQALRSRSGTLSIAVAVRLAVDMLQATLAAAQSLSSVDQRRGLRYLHPESVWIADFGEAFLSDVLISATLLPGSQLVASVAAPDVVEAGFHLLGLVCGSTDASALDDTRIPDQLRHVIARASGLEGSARYASVRELADALLEIDVLVATNEEVSQELRRVMGSALDIRRQKLAMTERAALQERSDDEETRFFRAAASPQLETARPPSPSTEAPSLVVAPLPVVAMPSEPPDDPTMIFRSPKGGVPSADELRTLQSAAVSATPGARSRSPSALGDGSFVPARSLLREHSPKDGQALQVTPGAAASPAQRRFLTRKRLAGLVLVLSAVIAFLLTSDGPQSDYDAARLAAHTGWQWLLEQGAALAHWALGAS